MKTRYTAAFEVPYSAADPKLMLERLKRYFSRYTRDEYEVVLKEHQGNPLIRVKHTLEADDRSIFQSDLQTFETLVANIVEALGEDRHHDLPSLAPRHILWANFTIRTVSQ